VSWGVDTAPKMGGFNDDGVGFNDHETSKQGAAAVRLSRRERIRRALLEAGPDGLTDYELEQRTGYRNAAQRRGELRNALQVRDRGVVRKNPETGVNQVVWSGFDDHGKPLS
jgi:hypothetical protein